MLNNQIQVRLEYPKLYSSFNGTIVEEWNEWRDHLHGWGSFGHNVSLGTTKYATFKPNQLSSLGCTSFLFSTHEKELFWEITLLHVQGENIKERSRHISTANLPRSHSAVDSINNEAWKVNTDLKQATR